MITKVVLALDGASELFGKIASWLTSVLMLLIIGDVVLRYLFNVSHVWVTELEWHIFALIFLLGAAYTLRHDAHVRVDLFYAGFSEKKKAFINLLGVCLFLIPWCLVVIRASIRYATNSYLIQETSPDPGGLPALWIIKSMIVVAFILLLLQGVSLLLKSIQVINGTRDAVFPPLI